jgi:hypothetical protein
MQLMSEHKNAVHHYGSYDSITASELLLAKSFYEAGDSFDVDRWINGHFADDAELTFGKNPIVKGRENIYQVMSNQCSVLAKMKHETHHLWSIGIFIMHECNVQYILKGDDKQIMAPGFAVLELTEKRDKVQSLRVYIDMWEVEARGKELSAK